MISIIKHVLLVFYIKLYILLYKENITLKDFNGDLKIEYNFKSIKNI